MEDSSGRRRFLSGIVVGLNAVTGLLLAVPALGYLLSPLLRARASTWVRLGPIGSFPAGQDTVVAEFSVHDDAGFTGGRVRRRAFVRRTDGGDVIALSSRCTHMGCNVSYNAGADSFECPCHGGRYDLEGNVIEGPPPRPLDRYRTRVAAGNLEIET